MRSIILLAIAVAVPAVEYRLPRHQTQVREDAWEIPTIIQDVRSPMAQAMPGMGMRDHGQIELGWRLRKPYWEDAVEGSRSPERVNAVEARVRLRATSWLAVEFSGSALFDDGDRYEYDFTDVEGLTAWTVYQDRYRGGSLVLGVGMPVGTGAEPPDTHVSDYKTPTYIAEWRMTESAGFHVFHLNVGARWNPSAMAEFEEPLVLEEGTIPADLEQDVVTVRGEGRLGWTWRLVRWVRVGAEGVYQIRSTKFKENDLRWSDREFTTAAFLECNLSRNFAIKGTFGTDPTHWRSDDGAVRTASAGISSRF